MSAILFLYKCKVKNWLKQSIHKPARLVLIFLMISSLIAMMSIPFGDLGRNMDDVPLPGEWFSASRISIIIFWVIAIFIIFSSVFSGAKNGAIIFSMADVHFLFSSPFRPQNVLLYGMLNTLATVLFSLFFLFYQYPNLSRAGISRSQFLLLLLIFVFGTLAAQLIQQSVYLFSSLHPNMRKFIRAGILILAVLLALGIAAWFFVFDRTFLALTDLLQNKILLYGVPFIGWLAQLFSGAMHGFTIHSLISFLLLLVVSTLGVVYSYQIEPDFYEEAIETTTRRTERQIRAKAGKSNVYIEKKAKVRKKGLRGGHGESAVLYMHLTEQRRTRPFIISFPMFLYLFFAGITTLQYSFGSDLDPSITVTIFTAIVAFSLFFLTMENPLLTDLKQPMFYYMPGSQWKKVFFAAISPMLYAIVDLLPAIIVLTIFVKAPPLVILGGWLAAVSFYLVYLSGQMITYMIMGSIQGTFSGMIYMTFTLLLLLPAAGTILASAIGDAFGATNLIPLGLIVATVVNIVIFLASTLAGKAQLNRGLNE